LMSLSPPAASDAIPRADRGSRGAAVEQLSRFRGLALPLQPPHPPPKPRAISSDFPVLSPFRQSCKTLAPGRCGENSGDCGTALESTETLEGVATDASLIAASSSVLYRRLTIRVRS